MAENARDVTVRFGANTSGFSAGVAEIVKKLDEYNKALIDNQSQIKSVSKETSELEKEQKKLQEKIKSGTATETEKQRYEQLTKEIEQHRLTLAQLRTDQTNIRNAISETSAELRNTSDGVEEADEKFSAWKITLADLAANAIQSLISKMLELAKSVIATGEEFTASMSEVQAISGATDEELQKLEKTARQYGATTMFSATQAAQALKYMSLAGWNAERSMAALGGILDLAAASGMDLAAASDMVTDYLSAFGMEADKSSYLADVLAYAQSHANTSAQQLGEAFGNCAANLNAAGQDVETVTAFLEAMANQGLKGSEAGTALAAMMREIGDAMKDGAIEINNTKIAVADSEGNYRDLTDIIKDVSAAVDGLGTADKTAALSSVFTSRSLKGLNLVLNEGIENVAGYEDALRSAGGTASEAADIMGDNLAGDIKSMNSAFDELKLKIFDSAETPLRNLVQTITSEGVPALESLINNFDKIAPVIVSATTAVLGYKAAIGIQSLIENVRAAFISLTAARTANTAATAANTNATNTDTAANAANAAAQNANTAATNSATVAQHGLNAAMKANPIVLLISLVASLAAGLATYSAAVNGAKIDTEKYMNAIEDAQKTAEASIAETNAKAEVISTLNERYDELRNKTNLNAQEQKQLDSIAQQLAQHLGLTTDEIKDQTGAYIDLNSQIETTIENMKRQAEMNAKTSVLEEAYKNRDSAKSAYDSKVDEYKKWYEENKEVMERYREGNASIWDEDTLKKAREYADEINSLKQAWEDCTDKVQEYESELDNFAKSESTTDEIVDDYMQIEQAREDLLNGGGQSFAEWFEDYKNGVEGAEEAVDTFAGSVGSAANGIERLREKLEEQNAALVLNQQAIKDLTREQNEIEKGLTELEEGSKLYEEAKKRIESINVELDALKLTQTEIKENIEDLEDTISNIDDTITDALGDIQDSYNDWQNAIEEVNDETNTTGTLSIKTLNSIQKKYPELIDLVNDYIMGIASEADVIAGLETAYNNDVKAYKNALINKQLASNQWYSDNILNNAAWVNNLKQQYGIDLQNFADCQKTKLQIQAEILKKQQEINAITLGMQNGQLYTLPDELLSADEKNTVDAARKEIQSLNNALSAIDQISKLYDEANKKIDDLTLTNNLTTMNNSSSSSSSSASSSNEDTALKAYQDKLDLAYEAYNKLINDRIDLIEEETKAAEKAADKKIAAIDKEIEARKRLNEDADRQAEIDAINAQLEYAQLDELSRRELERKKQDLLDEQAEVDWEREMEAKKEAIQNGLSVTQEKNNEAMDALKAASESAKNYFDKLAGTQTNSQIVNNNSDTRNIQIIQNALNDQQMVDKMLAAIYSK